MTDLSFAGGMTAGREWAATAPAGASSDDYVAEALRGMTADYRAGFRVGVTKAAGGKNGITAMQTADGRRWARHDSTQLW